MGGRDPTERRKGRDCGGREGGNRAEKEVASSTPLHIHEAPKCVAIDDKTEANRASNF